MDGPFALYSCRESRAIIPPDCERYQFQTGEVKARVNHLRELIDNKKKISLLLILPNYLSALFEAR